MAFQFRKSKKIGPFRITASKSGLSASTGAGPVRLSANTKGEVRRSVRVPGTGVYQTERIDNGKGGATPDRPASEPQPVAGPLPIDPRVRAIAVQWVETASADGDLDQKWRDDPEQAMHPLTTEMLGKPQWGDFLQAVEEIMFARTGVHRREP
jgi:hypothetical protein